MCQRVGLALLVLYQRRACSPPPPLCCGLKGCTRGGTIWCRGCGLGSSAPCQLPHSKAKREVPGSVRCSIGRACPHDLRSPAACPTPLVLRVNPPTHTGSSGLLQALGELPDSAAEDVRCCEQLYLSPLPVRFPLFCRLLSSRSLPVWTTLPAMRCTRPPCLPSPSPSPRDNVFVFIHPAFYRLSAISHS